MAFQHARLHVLEMAFHRQHVAQDFRAIAVALLQHELDLPAQAVEALEGGEGLCGVFGKHMYYR